MPLTFMSFQGKTRALVLIISLKSDINRWGGKVVAQGNRVKQRNAVSDVTIQAFGTYVTRYF